MCWAVGCLQKFPCSRIWACMEPCQSHSYTHVNWFAVDHENIKLDEGRKVPHMVQQIQILQQHIRHLLKDIIVNSGTKLPGVHSEADC